MGERDGLSNLISLFVIVSSPHDFFILMFFIIKLISSIVISSYNGSKVSDVLVEVGCSLEKFCVVLMVFLIFCFQELLYSVFSALNISSRCSLNAFVLSVSLVNLLLLFESVG